MFHTSLKALRAKLSFWSVNRQKDLFKCRVDLSRCEDGSVVRVAG